MNGEQSGTTFWSNGVIFGKSSGALKEEVERVEERPVHLN